MKDIVDSVGNFNAAQRVAGSLGLQLVAKEGCKQPCTSMVTGKVYVEKPSPYWDAAQWDKWRGEVYHEVGHHAPKLKDCLPFMESNNIGFDSLIGLLINVVEDVRNEMNDFGLYKGRDESLSKTQAYYCQRGVDSLSEHGLPEGKDKMLFTQALAMCYDWRAKYQPDLAIPSIEFSRLVDWSKYSHLQPMLDKLETIKDVYNIVIRMLEDSPDHSPEEEKEKAAAASEGKEGEKSEDSDEKEGGVADEVSYEDLMGHRHGEEGSSTFHSKIVYDHKGRDDYIPWTSMIVERARDLPGGSSRHVGEYESHYTKGAGLAGSARRLFQSVMQTRKSHNHKQGRLDKRDLYRVPSGAKDVFTRKENAADPRGCAVFVLVDASGSMSGRKFNVTAAAMALLNDACSPLGVPMKIAAFTERTPNAMHYIVKEYAEKRSKLQIFDDCARITRKMAQNADGESVMWAAKDLVARSEARKILIVLSDGSPASDNGGDCYTYTRDVIAHVSKWRGLELYGIGVQDRSVEKLYPEHEVLENVGDLEHCLLRLIKRKIFVI
jgi:hypothetical protein